MSSALGIIAFVALAAVLAGLSVLLVHRASPRGDADPNRDLIWLLVSPLLYLLRRANRPPR